MKKSSTDLKLKKSEILFDVPDQNIDEYSEKYNPDNQPNLERFDPPTDKYSTFL